jgi:UDP-N-acetylmuramoylalanine--D-glutamate ligase
MATSWPPPIDGHVLVAGSGVEGRAATRALLRLGAEVTVVDRIASDNTAALRRDGARVVIAETVPAGLFDGVREVIISPGFPPHHPLAVAAVDAGLAVYGQVELAWRLRGPGAAPWLAVTGTNGKTTTVTMLAAILTATGLRTAALGNVGEPLVDAVLDGDFDVLAVELSSQQLFWSRNLAPAAGAILNLAEDHLQWHGDFETYVRDKTAIWRGCTPDGGGVAVGNLDDPRVAALLAEVPGRAVGFTLGEPGAGQLGVLDGHLVDRAFGDFDAETRAETRGGQATRLAPVDVVRPPGKHNVANALAAAALARAYGVPAAAVAEGLRSYLPQPHRNALVATVGGVGYVDDSKATNPHAALSSLTAYPRVVWIAGGWLKGVDINDLVASVADRLAGAVLLGTDRDAVAAALARHAPQIPVVDVARTDDGAMGEVVAAAAALAAPGDTVLLAPAAASTDMFASYAHRGVAFAAAVRDLAVQDPPMRDLPGHGREGGR